MQSKDQQKLKEIISTIIKDETYEAFRYPVNWEEEGLTEYPNIIKRPMDLNQVLMKVQENMYQNMDQFLKEISLIWENCRIFNKKSSLIYQNSISLESQFKKLFKQYFPSFLDNKLNCFNDTITLQQQEKFKEDLLQQKMIVVGKIMIYFKENYPEVLMQKTEEEYILLLNKIPQIHLDKIYQEFLQQLIMKLLKYPLRKISKEIQNLLTTLKNEQSHEINKINFKPIQQYLHDNFWQIKYFEKENKCELMKEQEGLKIRILFRPQSQRPDLNEMKDVFKEYGEEEEIIEDLFGEVEKSFIMKFGVYIINRDKIFFCDYTQVNNQIQMERVSFLKESEIDDHQRNFLNDQNWLDGEITTDMVIPEVRQELDQFVRKIGLSKQFLENFQNLSMYLENLQYQNFLKEIRDFFSDENPKLIDKQIVNIDQLRIIYL